MTDMDTNTNNNLRPTPLNPLPMDDNPEPPAFDFNNPPPPEKIESPEQLTSLAGCVMDDFLTADTVVRLTNSRAGAAHMQTINAVFRMVDLKGPFDGIERLLGFMMTAHLYHCSIATYERLLEMERNNPKAEQFAALMRDVPRPADETMGWWEDLSDKLSVFHGGDWVAAYERKLYFLYRDMESIRIVLDRFLRDKHSCDHLDFYLTRTYPRPVKGNDNNDNNTSN